MKFMTFCSNLIDLDQNTQVSLSKSPVVITFYSGEGTAFDNIQRVIYKQGNNCYIIYVGYSTLYVSFMIQISKQFGETIARWGGVDNDRHSFYLDSYLGPKKVPFFSKMLSNDTNPKAPHFFIEPYNGHVCACISFATGEIKTQADFRKGIEAILNVGKKIFEEFDDAVNLRHKTSWTREIASLINLILHMS